MRCARSAKERKDKMVRRCGNEASSIEGVACANHELHTILMIEPRAAAHGVEPLPFLAAGCWLTDPRVTSQRGVEPLPLPCSANSPQPVISLSH